jgi:hypothetical protein
MRSHSATRGTTSFHTNATTDLRIGPTGLCHNSPKNRLWRDFLGRSISDFCNTIGAQPTFDEAMRSEKWAEADRVEVLRP